MLDEKQKKFSKSIITQLIREGKIKKSTKEIAFFFIDKAKNSLQVSKRLLELSENKDENLDCYMWVINTSYYSMFFAATSLLAHFNHKIDSEVGIHRLTFHALIYYFVIEDNKLQKHFIEQYKEAYENAEQLLQISEEKAREILENFNFERLKRQRFTYEIGKVAERNKAKTSLKRAEDFLVEVRKMVEIEKDDKIH